VKKLRGRAQVRLLSPNPQAMATLSREWERVIKKAGLVVGTPARADPVDETGRAFLGASLTELAATAFDPDNTAANGSSIAFIFEYQSKSILFGADAHSSVLLESLAKITKPGERYPLQACKLPHHGSRRNVPVELVTALQCKDWWFSTNGARFAHPSAETVARVLVHGDRPAVLRANYSTVEWDTFAADYPPTTHHPYELLRPTDGAEGLLIQLT
jgi:hypothetical protein